MFSEVTGGLYLPIDDIFYIKDPCAGLTFSETTPSVLYQTNNFRIIQSKLSGSGDSEDDPWVFKIEKHILTDNDYFRLQQIDYTSTNDTLIN